MENQIHQSPFQFHWLNKIKKSGSCLVEDLKLRTIVEKHGSKNWDLISSLMINRNSRQCKDRWENYLSPKVDLSLWTKEEDNLLIARRNEFGTHWVQIQHFFPKRTDIALKNRWNFLQREKHKNVQQKHDQHVDIITSKLSEPDSITNPQSYIMMQLQ
jgi:hypothetical protein